MGEDEELEKIRNQKMAQLQNQMSSQDAQEEAMQQQKEALEAKKKAILRQVLTPEARERLARLRLVKPELVDNVEMQIIYLVEAGRIQNMINDATLKDLLRKLQNQKPKKEFNIEYK